MNFIYFVLKMKSDLKHSLILCNKEKLKIFISETQMHAIGAKSLTISGYRS